MDTHETEQRLVGSPHLAKLWERKEASEVNQTLYLGGDFVYPAWVLLGARIDGSNAASEEAPLPLEERFLGFRQHLTVFDEFICPSEAETWNEMHPEAPVRPMPTKAQLRSTFKSVASEGCQEGRDEAFAEALSETFVLKERCDAVLAILMHGADRAPIYRKKAAVMRGHSVEQEKRIKRLMKTWPRFVLLGLQGLRSIVG